MKRILLILVVAALMVIAVLPHACFAQSLLSKQAAADIIAKAESQRELTKPGSLPFHLIARIHYQAGSFSADGTYEVLWASPDRFRQEFRLGPMSESDLVVGDKEYVLRDTPSAAYFVSRVQSLAGLAGGDDSPLAERVAKVYATQRPYLLWRVENAYMLSGDDQRSVGESVGKIYASDGATGKVICVQMTGRAKGHTACVDASTNRLVSDVRVGQRSDFKPRIQASTFFDFGPVRYPADVILSVEDEQLEIKVQKLNQVTRFADDVFSLPASASEFVWCAHPQMEGGADPGQGLMLMISLLGRTKGFHAFYFKVGADGTIEEIDEIHRDGKSRRWLVRGIDQQRLSVRTCEGKPVEYESVPAAWVPVTAY
jgi:hypothetical protein